MLASRLNPSAAPFEPFSLALVCLLPRPPPPHWASYWCSGGFASKVCPRALIAGQGPHAFPPLAPWLGPVEVYVCPSPPSPPRSAHRCSITEIGEGGDEESAKEELQDEVSPRSVLTEWRMKPPTSLQPRRAAVQRVPPPPPPGLRGKAQGRLKQWDDSTASLMLRNIPNRFLKNRLMAILDQHCVEENAKLGGDAADDKSEYDFLYVPVDFRTKCNKGYAFVNMTTATAARRLRAFLDGHPWVAVGSHKVCAVVPARIKGRDALMAHFSGSRFPSDGDREFLPVRFEPPRDGVRPTAEHVVGELVLAPAQK